MRKKVVVLLIFLVLMIIMTYPLIFKISTHIPGFFSTDEPYAALWDSWRIKYSWQNGLSLRYTPLIAYPFGVDLYASGYLSYIWMGWIYLLSILTASTITYNLQVFINLFLSGIFIYLLLFYLTKNRPAAVFSGIIFAFCPYQFARIWQHLGLTYNEWIPLILLSAILLKERSSKKQMVLLLLSILLLLSFDYSIMYFGMMVLMSFLLYSFLYHWKLKLFKERNLIISDFRYFKKVVLIGLLAFIILTPQFFPVIKNRIRLSSTTTAFAFNPYYRPFEDLFSQSARPLSYLLPATVHPVFGKFTERFIGSPLYGVSYTEHTLYLGWTPIILSFVAYRGWKKRRKNYKSEILNSATRIDGLANLCGEPKSEINPKSQIPNPKPITNNEDFYIGFFVLLAIVAWLFSQPPWWKLGGFRIFLPSFFMYKILPMFRAYCRFGIVVMFAVSVLAGFGLKNIISKIKNQKSKLLITTLFCGLVLFEFWNYPPFKVIDVSKVPQIYYWLKEQPGDFAIAEYPLDANSPNEMYKFYQTVHEKKIINGTIPGTYANKVAQEIRNLSEPRTAGILRWMAVKYILVHHDGYLNSELVEVQEEFNKISTNPCLKLVKTFPPQDCPSKIMCTQKTGRIDVYEVMAEPICLSN